jgi:hypothetical protein
VFEAMRIITLLFLEVVSADLEFASGIGEEKVA